MRSFLHSALHVRTHGTRVGRVLVTLAKLVALTAAVGGAMLPASAHASGTGGPSVTGGGTGPYPGYTWQLVFYPAATNMDGVDENVLYVWGPTGTATGAPDLLPEWMSVNAGPWYQFTVQSDGIGGYVVALAGASTVPGFLDAAVDGPGYALFQTAVQNTVNPPLLPVFPPPPIAPPTLDANPDPDSPPDAPAPPDIPPTDPGIGDPGGDWTDPGDAAPTDPSGGGGGCCVDILLT